MEQDLGAEAGLFGMFEYATDLFDEATIARMASHFIVLLESIVVQPEQTIYQFPMLTDTEYHQIIHEWNDTAHGIDGRFGEPQTIHALFEQQVERTPDAIAVVFENEQLTYQELNARTNQIAHHLIELGVQADTLVAVAMERSVEMVVGLLAVLKAGGAYVPIDPTYPDGPIRYMLADSSAPILLTHSHLPLAQQIEDADTEASMGQLSHLITVDMMAEQLAAQPTDNPQTETCTADLAYVIYTSGSTGQPKGVMIEHQSLVTHISHVGRSYAITSQDRVLQFSAFSFDAAQEQILAALCNGATLVLRGDEVWTGEELNQQIACHRVTILDLPPAYFQAILPKWLKQRPSFLDHQLRLILLGGEKVSPEVVDLWPLLAAPATSLLNVYGPTETTITATLFDLSTYQPETMPLTLPIGKPLPGREAYILDRFSQPVPIGVWGELHLGGVGLARGYLNRAELTDQLFISNPFAAKANPSRLYKTGDLCRWLPDGNIQFIGRTDFEVKLRGFRIELGKIEAVLSQHAAVQEAVVIAREEKAGEKRLVAYLSHVPSAMLDTSSLPRYLQSKIPNYMIPSTFVLLETLPLTPTGKIDRKALTKNSFGSQMPLLTAGSEFVPPKTPTEEALADIWAEVLGLERIGRHDNFFELGGHSFLAIQLVSRISSLFAVKISVKFLFLHPTIAEQAEDLQNYQTSQTISSPSLTCYPTPIK